MLDGTTVLVVEAEFLIALDLQRMLEGLGSSQVLFARGAQEAQALQDHWSKVTLAIVEVALERDSAIELVTRLLAINIPVVLCSSDISIRFGLPQFPDVPVLTKPMAESELIRAIGQVLLQPS